MSGAFWFSRLAAPSCALALCTLALPACDGSVTETEMDDVTSAIHGSGPGPSSECVTIQRGAFGSVADAYLKSNAWHKNTGAQPLLRVSGREAALLRFDLASIPSSAAISRATLKLYVNGQNGDGSTEVHRILKPWSEVSVTFASFGQSFVASPAASFRVETRTALKSVDVTSLVRNWV